MDSIQLQTTLKSLAIKAGKEQGDDPIVTLTLTGELDDEWKALFGRVGQTIELEVKFAQAALPMIRR